MREAITEIRNTPILALPQIEDLTRTDENTKALWDAVKDYQEKVPTPSLADRVRLRALANMIREHAGEF